MKKLFPLPLLIVLLVIGCKKKFSDGPLISFRSVAERVKGQWELENYIINGTDSTSYYNSALGDKCNIWFYPASEGYGYTIKWGTDSLKKYYDGGNYSLSKDTLYFGYADIQPILQGIDLPRNVVVAFEFTQGYVRDYTILKCKDDEIWLRTVNFNTTYELHFKLLNKNI